MNEKASFVPSIVTQDANPGREPLSGCSVFRKLSLFCASVFCAVALLLPLLSSAAEDNKSQLKGIQQSIAEKEKEVKQQQQQRDSLQEQLKRQEETIAQASRSLRDTQGILALLSQDITELTRSMAQLQKQQLTQQDLLAQQLNAAFRQGQHGALQLLLSGEESQRNERMLAYFGYLNDARQHSIEQLEKTQALLAEKKSLLLSKQGQQTSLFTDQQSQQQKLQQARSARQKTLTSLEASLEKDQLQLVELRQNEARLRDKITRAEREAKARAEREAREAAKVRQQVQAKEQQAKKTGTRYKPSEGERSLMARTGGLGRSSGQAIWPVRGRIEHRFGEPLQGELRWKGMVITAAEGSEVKAIADGRVLLADWLQGYGLVVVVEHGKGDMSLYGYNQSALVNVGAQVRAGQPIALVGTSGGQGTPSLYFEIRRQGQAVNPQPWLGK